MSLPQLIKECIYLVEEKDTVTLKKKHSYYAQVQLGMAVLNLKQCDFVVYCSSENNLIVIKVDLDTDYVHKLTAKLKNIFFTKMLHTVCENKKRL